MSLNIVGFAGSLRKDSFNRQLLDALAEAAPAEWKFTKLTIDAIPFFNADVEAVDTPQVVKDFKAAIAAADAVIIFTPEYDHGVPGVLKNTLDWSSREQSHEVFLGKPIAIGGTTTGNWGTVRSQLSLRLILAAMGAHVMPRNYLFVPQARDKFKDGKLIDSAAKESLAKFIAGAQKYFSIFN